MAIPSDVDQRAVELFETAGWAWDNFKKAFVETREPEREPTADYRKRPPRAIGYGELQDHGLAGPTSSSNRDSGLVWLRRVLGLGE